MPRALRLDRIVPVALAALITLLVFWNLGQGSLKPWDEGLTGERIREMAAGGDLLTPHLFGEPDFNKPPLYYVLSLPVWFLTGQGEFAVRFWSVVFALACAALAYRLTVSRGLDRTWGMVAATLLLTNAHWQNWTRMGLLDSGFALSIMAALALLDGPRITRQRALAAGLALAAGSLIKYPLVLLAVPAVAAANLLRYRRLQLRAMLMASGIAVGIVILWSLAQFALHGHEWLEFQRYNFVDRFTQSVEGHAATSLIYWDTLMEQVRVQTLLLIVTVAGAALAARPGYRRVMPEFIFLLGWVALMLITSSKRATYLLPAYPFAAVITAQLLGEVCRSSSRQAVAVVLVTACLVDMVDHVEVMPDYSPQMASVARAIVQDPIDGGFLDVDSRQEQHLLAFYSRQIPRYVAADRLATWWERPEVQDGRGGYLCVETDVARDIEELVFRELSHLYRIEKAAANGRYELFAFHAWQGDDEPLIRRIRGWQAQEDWGRWIRGDSATIEVYGADDPACLVIRTTSWLPDQGPVRCEVLCDGRQVGEFEVQTRPWTWQEYRVSLPAANGTARPVELRFPTDGADADDPRRRSLPVQSLSVVRCDPQP